MMEEAIDIVNDWPEKDLYVEYQQTITNIIYESNKYDLYFKGKFLEQYNNLHEILGVISFKTNGYGYNKSKCYCIRKPDGTWYKKERVTF